MEDKPVAHDPEAHLSLTQMLEGGRKRLVKVSYGGGTDSTALLIACKERNIPIDIILFSDTGGEKPWGLTRAQCVESIVRAGLPLPGKSACFFCPNSKKDEIHDLKERYPSLLDRALHMEQHGLQKSTSVKGLGRRFNWGELVAEKKEAQEIAEFSDTEMPCGCYDGD